MQKYVTYFEEEYTPCGNWLNFFFFFFIKIGVIVMSTVINVNSLKIYFFL